MMEIQLHHISEDLEQNPVHGQLATSCRISDTPPGVNSGQTARLNKSSIFFKQPQLVVCSILPFLHLVNTLYREIEYFREPPSVLMISVAKIEEPELVIMIKEFVLSYSVTPQTTQDATPIDQQLR